MTRYTRGKDRDELLAEVAELYYEDALTQAEIARTIGLTRSAVSRMLTEAREKGIVEIKIRRPLSFDEELEQALVDRFNLLGAHVLTWQTEGQYDRLRGQLGKAAAQVLQTMLTPHMTLGVAWGNTVSATIDELELSDQIALQVVQLVGVLGSSSHAFNAQALVENIARMAGGKGVYLYSPFIVEDANTARVLLNSQNVREAMTAGKACDIALLGIGTTRADYCSLYLGGHISQRELESLQAAGAVGDVCAHHFSIDGHLCTLEFHKRLVGIAREDLLAIPTRLGVAGHKAKAPAILGALRGGYINLLVTDSQAAELVLEMAEQHY